MAFPAVATTNTSTQDAGNTTTHTVDLPSGIVSGNLLLIFFSIDGSGAVTVPTGWTRILDTANGAACRFNIFYRQADGTEGATIDITSSSSERSAHVTYRITGHEDPTTQAPEVGGTNTGATTFPDANSISPTGGPKDFLLIAAEGHDRNRTTTGIPTDYTDSLSSAGGGANSAGVGTARRELNFTTHNPTNFQISSSDQWVCTTVAVHPAAAGQTVTLGLATETDTAFAVPFDLRRLVTLATETGAAFAIVPLRTVPIGLASDAETAFPMPFDVRRLVAQALETDIAVAMTIDLRRLAAQAVETDTAFVITPSLAGQTVIIGLATETDTGQPVVPLRIVSIGLALDTETAFPMDFDQRRLILQALETDTAVVITPLRARAILQALETDTGQPVVPLRIVSIGLASDTDTAFSVTPERIYALLQALETDTAFSITFDARRLAALATETDTAFVITPALTSGGPAGGIYPRLRRRRRSC